MYGHTIFSNREMAYEALFDGMVAMLATLSIHYEGCYKSRYGGKSRAAGIES